MCHLKYFPTVLVLFCAKLTFTFERMSHNSSFSEHPKEWFAVILTRLRRNLLLCQTTYFHDIKESFPLCQNRWQVTHQLFQSFRGWVLSFQIFENPDHTTSDKSDSDKLLVGVLVFRNNVDFGQINLQLNWLWFSPIAINITFTKFQLLYNCYLQPVVYFSAFVEQLEVVKSNLRFCGQRPQWSLFIISTAHLIFTSVQNTMSQFEIIYQITDKDVETLKYTLKETSLMESHRSALHVLKYYKTQVALFSFVARKDENIVIHGSNTSVFGVKVNVLDGPGILSPEVRMNTQRSLYICSTFQCTMKFHWTTNDPNSQNLNCSFATTKQFQNVNVTLYDDTSMQLPTNTCSVASGFFCMISIKTPQMFAKCTISEIVVKGKPAN